MYRVTFEPFTETHAYDDLSLAIQAASVFAHRADAYSAIVRDQRGRIVLQIRDDGSTFVPPANLSEELRLASEQTKLAARLEASAPTHPGAPSTEQVAVGPGASRYATIKAADLDAEVLPVTSMAHAFKLAIGKHGSIAGVKLG